MENNNESEEKAIQPKKNSNIVLIVVGLILIIGVGIGCFFLGQNTAKNNSDKENNKESNTESNNNEEKTNTEKNDNNDIYENVDISIGEQLIEVLTSYGSINNGAFEFEKISYFANDKIVDASSLNHELVYQVVFNKYYSNYPDEISLDDFNSKVKQLFDDSYSYVAKDYYDRCSGMGYKLDSNKYYKVPSNGGCGGTGYVLAPYKVTSVLKNNNRLIVKVKVLFGITANKNGVNTAIYYSDYAKTKMINGANQDNYENYLDEGTVYKFTFINRNGIYLFSRSEIE